MDILLTVVLLAAIGLGIIATQIKGSLKSETKMNSDQNNISSPSGDTLSSSGSATSPVLPPPTPPTPKSSPQESANTSGVNVSDFQYPGAVVNNSSSSHLSLQSSDDPGKITDWYKQKIIAAGANVKSFVTTKTNDNVLNNLSGANGKVNISVKISKPSASSTVSIDVTISSP